MADFNDIQEGFLCPICHKDMRSPNSLIAHFQELHSEEKEFLKSIKSIYGNFKKVLKIDDQDFENFKREVTIDNTLEGSQPQDPGPSRSHTDYFKAVRRERLDHRTTEINKLIIRLDKLLRTHGPDRKQQEQELVTWLDGTTVTRCPSCASSFNIARRQHHCRLCGSIMCGSCSHFLTYELAQTIVMPFSNISLDHSNSDSDGLRICLHCLNMLESRRQVQVNQMIEPLVCHLYSMLDKNKSSANEQVESYYKIYNLLTSGDTTFHLEDLQSLRSSIATTGQMIDTLSKKIASLSIDTTKAAVVHNNIRKATSTYIKEYLLALPPPPTVEELEEIRRRDARMLKDDYLPKPSTSHLRVQKVATGWSPANDSNVVKVDEEEHPLIEQMNIVKNYIVQARKAHRYEEVASLEANLKMLEETYGMELKSKAT